jgi:hypothetical protein
MKQELLLKEWELKNERKIKILKLHIFIKFQKKILIYQKRVI